MLLARIMRDTLCIYKHNFKKNGRYVHAYVKGILQTRCVMPRVDLEGGHDTRFSPCSSLNPSVILHPLSPCNRHNTVYLFCLECSFKNVFSYILLKSIFAI